MLLLLFFFLFLLYLSLLLAEHHIYLAYLFISLLSSPLSLSSLFSLFLSPFSLFFLCLSPLLLISPFLSPLLLISLFLSPLLLFSLSHSSISLVPCPDQLIMPYALHQIFSFMLIVCGRPPRSIIILYLLLSCFHSSSYASPPHLQPLLFLVDT